MTDPETGDLKVNAGRLAVGDTTAQTAECVLRAVRGEFKEHPLIGAEILKMLGGSPESDVESGCKDHVTGVRRVRVARRNEGRTDNDRV